MKENEDEDMIDDIVQQSIGYGYGQKNLTF
jgi:hypothetical protein